MGISFESYRINKSIESFIEFKARFFKHLNKLILTFYFSKLFPPAEILICESVLYVDSKNI